MIEMCRTCLSRSPPFFPLFSNKNYAEKIKIIAAIDINKQANGFPTVICETCDKNIEDYFAFRLQIQETNKALENINRENAVILGTCDDLNLNRLNIKKETLSIEVDKESPIERSKVKKTTKNHLSDAIQHTNVFIQEFSSMDDQFPTNNEIIEQETNRDNYDGCLKMNKHEIGDTNKIEYIHETVDEDEIVSRDEIADEDEIANEDEMANEDEIADEAEIADEDEIADENEILDESKALNKKKAARIKKTFNEEPTVHNKIKGTRQSLQDLINSLIPVKSIYKCRNCNFISACNIFYYRHLVFKVCQTGGPIKKPKLPKGMYGCNKCTYITLSKQRYGHHKIWHNNLERGKVYKCRHCDFTTPKKHAIYLHELNKHPSKELERIPCDICGKFLKRENMRAHLMVHQGKVKCDECQKTFTTIHGLKQHTKNHIRKDCVCEICGRTFEYEGIYMIHLKHHKRDKKKTCTICNKSLYSRMMSRHMRKHTGERPYKCEICQKGLTTSHNLKIHMRQHTDERPFKCNICENSFRVKVSLKTHMKSRHNVEF